MTPFLLALAAPAGSATRSELAQAIPSHHEPTSKAENWAARPHDIGFPWGPRLLGGHDDERPLISLDLRTLLEADPVDPAQVEAKLREIEPLRVTLRLSQIRTIERGKAELTPEQRAKLRSLLTLPEAPRAFVRRAGLGPPTFG